MVHNESQWLFFFQLLKKWVYQTKDGSVVAWGQANYGGNISSVQCQLVDVIKLQSTDFAFAAILSNGSVVTWGSPNHGGDSSAVKEQLKDVQQIQATNSAFAAILSDGSVVTWGNPSHGGDSSRVQEKLMFVMEVQSTAFAFAALLLDGSVVAWGHEECGCDTTAVQNQLIKVQQIHANELAFASILADGSVVAWGGAKNGGDSSAVQNNLVNVKHIQSTALAFAAVRSDRSVVTWGGPYSGGNSYAVQDQLVNVKEIQSTRRAFAAILFDGSVVTWGSPNHGGDSSAVKEQLKDVQQIQATNSAFAAILGDGSIVTWGNPDHGGEMETTTWTRGDMAEIWRNAVLLSDLYTLYIPRPSSQVSNFSPEKSVLVIKGHKFHSLLEDSSTIIYTLYDHRSRGIPRRGFHKNRVGSDLSVPNIAGSIFQKDAEWTPQHLGPWIFHLVIRPIGGCLIHVPWLPRVEDALIIRHAGSTSCWKKGVNFQRTFGAHANGKRTSSGEHWRKMAFQSWKRRAFEIPTTSKRFGRTSQRQRINVEKVPEGVLLVNYVYVVLWVVVWKQACHGWIMSILRYFEGFRLKFSPFAPPCPPLVVWFLPVESPCDIFWSSLSHDSSEVPLFSVTSRIYPPS